MTLERLEQVRALQLEISELYARLRRLRLWEPDTPTVALRGELRARVMAQEALLAEAEAWVNALPPAQAQVMRLRYFEGLEWEAMAKRTHYSVTSLCRQRRCALQRLEAPGRPGQGVATVQPGPAAQAQQIS